MEIEKYNSNLPDTAEKLNEFILIGDEQRKAHLAKIRALEKVGAAQAVKEAAIKKGQDWAELIIDAKAKLGRVLEAIPNKKSSSGSGTRSLPPGISKKESHHSQEIARHLDIVEIGKQDIKK